MFLSCVAFWLDTSVTDPLITNLNLFLPFPVIILLLVSKTFDQSVRGGAIAISAALVGNH